MPETIVDHQPRPLVSVVIPCYQQGHFLAEAIKSVLDQTYDNWEIVVVDDGSTDDTSAVATDIARMFSDKTIRLIQKTNGGLADARNTGIRAAQGSLILPLDADDMIASTFLDKAVTILANHPKTNVVYADLQEFGERAGTWITNFSRDALLCDNCMPYASLYRKDLWERTGGYDRSVPWGCEDWNFWISCLPFGLHVEKIPERLFLYRVRSDGMLSRMSRYKHEVYACVRTLHSSLYTAEQIRADQRTIAHARPETVEIIKQRIERFPELAMPHFWLGLVHDRLGDPLSARAEYERNLALDPNHWQAMEKIAPETPRVFWDNFVKPNDLVFDVGAHIGAKTDAFLARDARVIAIEPQSACVQRLREKFADNDNVTIVSNGMSDHSGTEELSVCTVAPTISTIASQWKTGRFAGYNWDQTTTIEVTTLDSVISEFGLPSYCKIDVEGYELQVLLGLTQPIPLLSFEFTIEFIENVKRCLDHLATLGYTMFNLAIGENDRFHFPLWVSALEIIEFVRTSSDPVLWGDIYAFCDADIKALDPNRKNLVEQIQSNREYPAPTPEPDEREILLAQARAVHPGQPVRLHLGCGEQHFSGYVNIDHPSDQHNVMRSVADIQADVRHLDFPDGSIDEIRLHHVFEHFPRVVALALLIRWHRWLKVGGPGADKDFGYPLEISSSLYLSADILRVLDHIKLSGPNHLEAQMSSLSGALASSKPHLICLDQSVVFCNPINIVQTVCANRSGTNSEYSAEALAGRFAGGQRIDVEAFDGFVPNGCHQEATLEFEHRRPIPAIGR